jgi:RNA polymerase sigma-70 factor (ECF subfamily)
VVDARTVTRLVDEAHRRHWSAVVGATARVTRDLDLAEDCAQDAYVQALRTWPGGAPDNTAAWLVTVARRTALDRLRRETTLRRKLPLLLVERGEADDEPSASDPLRLVFTCCHPALSRDAQLPLTLRLMCGLSTADIAKVLLLKEAAVAARITRAKRKIGAAGVPFRLPSDTRAACAARHGAHRGPPRLHRRALPATRADVLARLGRNDDASAAYDAALVLTGNETERRFLQHRRATL